MGGIISLPPEMKHLIFKEAFDASDGDIHIGVENNDGTTLDFPALDIVKKLQKVDQQLCDEAKSYLFSKSFRFVFSPGQWPHMYVLRAFRKEVSHEWSKRVIHVSLAKFTVHGMFEQDKDRCNGIFGFERIISNYYRFGSELSLKNWFVDFAEYVRLKDDINDSVDAHAPPYLAHLVAINNGVSEMFYTSTIRKELLYGPRLLQMAFPGLEKLDVGFDIIDILPFEILGHDPAHPLKFLGPFGNDRIKRSQAFCTLLELRGFTISRKGTNIADINIRIFWGDFAQRSWPFEQLGISQEDQEILQNLFLTLLRVHFPSKDIIGCIL